MNLMTKKEIRLAALKARNAMPGTLRERESAAIAQKLYDSQCYIQSKTLLLYANDGSEVATDRIFDRAFADAKTIYYPKVRNGFQMDFFHISSLSDLSLGAFGIREPLGNTQIFEVGSVKKPVLMLMPGVAFDRTGNRIGYGKGYYDRFLAEIGSREYLKTAVLCFGCQMYEEIPTEEIDIAVDWVVNV